MATEGSGSTSKYDQYFQSPNYGIITNAAERQEEFDKLNQDLYESNSLLRKTFRANGVFEPSDMTYNRKFYRFPRNDPFNYVDGAREYIFITKTDLPLVGNDLTLTDDAKQIQYFNYLMYCGYKNSVFSNLCYSSGASSNDGGCPFMRILSNRKTSNVDVPDINVDELETSVNMFGTRILYPKSSMGSDENIDFSIEFEDTRHLEIYNLFKAYDIYRQMKWLGILGPGVNPKDDRFFHFITNKILYDHMSLYKFLVDSDGETLLWWGKFTGIFPKSITRSSFSEIQDRGPLKVTVGFKLSGWFEDMNPMTLIEFNELIEHWIGGDYASDARTADIYDSDIGMVSGESVEYPYIKLAEQSSGDYTHSYLLWGN